MYKIFNLHFTDMCNYQCIYCFINKQKNTLSINNIKIIIDNIKRYYNKNKIKDGRINLSGGEPLTCSYLQEIIDYIYLQEIFISLITNGSLLSEEFIIRNKNKISTIGISIDSLNEERNRKIRRCNHVEEVLSYNKLIRLCNVIKKENINLKINICITKYNIEESFYSFLSQIKPNRLKLLQMTIIDKVNNSCSNITISNDRFKKFCDNYAEFNPVIEAHYMIENGYLIIDSWGYIGINNAHKNHLFDLTKVELNDIINQILVDKKHYVYRYL